MSKRKDAFLNRADLSGSNPQDHSDCDRCDDEIIFRLKDNHHEFSIGLTTILNCLKLAEDKNAIPKLSDKWWMSIKSRYKIYEK